MRCHMAQGCNYKASRSSNHNLDNQPRFYHPKAYDRISPNPLPRVKVVNYVQWSNVAFLITLMALGMTMCCRDVSLLVISPDGQMDPDVNHILWYITVTLPCINGAPMHIIIIVQGRQFF